MRKLQGEKREFPGTEAKPPRPLVWLGKRLLALALASGGAAYAFHLFGTWPLGVIAIATPSGGWVALILAIQRTFRRPSTWALPNSKELDAAYIGRATKQSIALLDAQRDARRRFGL